MVMKQNITVQLDQAVIKDAKVVAARRSTSLSKLLAGEIQRIAAQESDYEQSKKSALARLHKSYSLGGVKMPPREELYSR
jgi:hypothetical protein